MSLHLSFALLGSFLPKVWVPALEVSDSVVLRQARLFFRALFVVLRSFEHNAAENGSASIIMSYRWTGPYSVGIVTNRKSPSIASRVRGLITEGHLRLSVMYSYTHRPVIETDSF
jgi:hypothetical protein